MQARGPLMIEHRLIERMLDVITVKLALTEKTREIDPLFIDQAVDFIRTYADRTHHGKEEDIMFRDLDNKEMSAADQKIMQELVQEHVFGRKTTRALVDANSRYRNGDAEALADIVDSLRTLVDFYPGHIEKEDTIFFPASRAYLSEAEEQKMLAEFEEFDRQMIHKKYRNMVDELAGP